MIILFFHLKEPQFGNRCSTHHFSCPVTRTCTTFAFDTINITINIIVLLASSTVQAQDHHGKDAQSRDKRDYNEIGVCALTAHALGSVPAWLQPKNKDAVPFLFGLYSCALQLFFFCAMHCFPSNGPRTFVLLYIEAGIISFPLESF